MSLIIESLTHLGAGRANDGTLVPRTLPGEEVALRPDGTPQILTPSAQRVAAPCRHFKTCGGCALQHAADDFVAEWKQTVVARALLAHGLEPEFRPMHTSPAQSRRRAKFSGRRTKSGAMVGFHARASDVLVAVPDCQLVTPGMLAGIPMLEALTVISASRRGEVALTVTDSAAGLDVLVQTDQRLTDQLRIELAGFAQQHKLSRLTWVDETVVTLRDPPSTSPSNAPPETPSSRAPREPLLAPPRKPPSSAPREPLRPRCVSCRQAQPPRLAAFAQIWQSFAQTRGHNVRQWHASSVASEANPTRSTASPP